MSNQSDGLKNIAIIAIYYFKSCFSIRTYFNFNGKIQSHGVIIILIEYYFHSAASSRVLCEILFELFIENKKTNGESEKNFPDPNMPSI